MCFSLYTSHCSDTLIARRVLKPIHNLKIETNERESERRWEADRLSDAANYAMRCAFACRSSVSPITSNQTVNECELPATVALSPLGCYAKLLYLTFSYQLPAAYTQAKTQCQVVVHTRKSSDSTLFKKKNPLPGGFVPTDVSETVMSEWWDSYWWGTAQYRKFIKKNFVRSRGGGGS